MLIQIFWGQILWGSALLFLLGGCTLLFQIEDLDSPPAHIKPLNLREIPVAFSHIWDDDHNFHLAGAAAIDVDNDGRFEIFVGGGRGQDDALLTFENNKLVNKIKGTGYPAATPPMARSPLISTMTKMLTSSCRAIKA